MPVIFICILIFVLWIRYQVNHSSHIVESSSEAFWKREDEANHTRNVSIDSLDYIIVPIDQLPQYETNDPRLEELQNILTDIASTQILNLSGFTNTDLKLKYGTGHFTYLAQCDANYHTLIHTIEKLGAFHMDNNHTDAAIAYYEYAVLCNSENSQTYVSLVKLYASKDNIPAIDALQLKLKQSDYKQKAYILKKVEQALMEL